MTRESADHLDELAGLFYFIQGVVQERTASEWIRSDLSAAQFKTLFFVFLRGPLSVKGIGEMLGITQPTASHLVEKLVQAGLLERIENPADRRSVQVKVLPAGEEVANNLWRGRRVFMRSWLERLTPDEVEALQKGLTALQRIALAETSEQIEREGKDK